ncbi:hypothetical protein ACW95P_00715 [Candidatus Mycoplasma pogonae]
MNKKLIRPLIIGSAVGVVAITIGVVVAVTLPSGSKDKKTVVQPKEELTIAFVSAKTSSFKIEVKNLEAYKKQTLTVKVYKKNSKVTDSATKTKSIDVAEKTSSILEFTGLSAATQYVIEIFNDKNEVIITSSAQTNPIPPQTKTPLGMKFENITTTSMKVVLVGLDAFVGKEVFLQYNPKPTANTTTSSSNDKVTPIDSAPMKVTYSNKNSLTFNLTNLSPNTEYLFNLLEKKQNKSNEIIINNEEAKTYANLGASEILQTSNTIALVIAGLEKYNNQNLVARLYNKAYADKMAREKVITEAAKKEEEEKAKVAPKPNASPTSSLKISSFNLLEAPGEEATPSDPETPSPSERTKPVAETPKDSESTESSTSDSTSSVATQPDAESATTTEDSKAKSNEDSAEAKVTDETETKAEEVASESENNPDEPAPALEPPAPSEPASPTESPSTDEDATKVEEDSEPTTDPTSSETDKTKEATTSAETNPNDDGSKDLNPDSAEPNPENKSPTAKEEEEEEEEGKSDSSDKTDEEINSQPDTQDSPTDDSKDSEAVVPKSEVPEELLETVKVINGELKVTFNNLKTNTEYGFQIVKQVAGKADEVIFNQAPGKDLKTTNEVTATATPGPISSQINVKNLAYSQPINQNSKIELLIRFAEKTSETKDFGKIFAGDKDYSEAIVQGQVSATHATDGVNFLLNNLKANKSYVYQIYLKNLVSAPLLKIPGEFTTEKQFILKPAADTTHPNPVIEKSKAILTFTNSELKYKDKTLELRYTTDLTKGFFATNTLKLESTTSEVGTADSKTIEVTFTLNGLESQTQYYYQLFIKGNQNPLLAETGTFTSAKSVKVNIESISTSKIVLRLTDLDAYVGKTLKLITDEIEAKDATENGNWVTKTISGITNENANNLLVELTTTELPSEKIYGYNLYLDNEAIAAKPTEVGFKTNGNELFSSEEQGIKYPLLQLLKIEQKTLSYNQFVVKLANLKSLVGYTLSIMYKKNLATENYQLGQKIILNPENSKTEVLLTLNNLEKNTPYQYKIVAHKTLDDNQSEQVFDVVSETNFTTLAEPKIAIANLTGSGVKLTANHLAAYINKELRILYKKLGESKWMNAGTTDQKITDATTNIEVTLSGLDSETSYQYNLAVKNGENYEPIFKDSLSFQTEKTIAK